MWMLQACWQQTAMQSCTGRGNAVTQLAGTRCRCMLAVTTLQALACSEITLQVACCTHLQRVLGHRVHGDAQLTEVGSVGRQVREGALGQDLAWEMGTMVELLEWVRGSSCWREASGFSCCQASWQMQLGNAVLGMEVAPYILERRGCSPTEQREWWLFPVQGSVQAHHCCCCGPPCRVQCAGSPARSCTHSRVYLPVGARRAAPRGEAHLGAHAQLLLPISAAVTQQQP